MKFLDAQFFHVTSNLNERLAYAENPVAAASRSPTVWSDSSNPLLALSFHFQCCFCSLHPAQIAVKEIGELGPMIMRRKDERKKSME
jgi:hypothetical protein